MNTDTLRDLVKRAAKDGDGQPVRDMVVVMNHHRLTPHEFVALNEKEMVKRVTAYVAAIPPGQGMPANMANPERLARRFLYAMARLCVQFTDVGLPTVAEPGDKCLHPLAVERQVGLLAREVDRWTPRLLGEDPSQGCGRAIKPACKIEYIGKVWLLAGVCATAMDFNDEVGIKAMISPVIVDVWLPIVAGHYSKTSLAPFISAIVRFGADTLGENNRDVKTLRAHVGRYFASPALTKDQVKQARALAASADVRPALFGRCRPPSWYAPGSRAG